MFWLLMVYPRAALVAAVMLVLLAVILVWVPRYPVLGVIGFVLVAAGGIELSTRVARWEPRRHGGTGYEGSGPIEPRGPGSGTAPRRHRGADER